MKNLPEAVCQGPTETADNERGAVLPIVAIMLTMLLMFAAFTVDLGMAWAVRRGEQTAADTAVLAAAVEFQTPGAHPQIAVDKLTEFAEKNANRVITTAQWTACADPDQLDYTASTLDLSPDTECISFGFSAEGDEIRVRLPDNPVPTSFGRLAGVDVINVSAAANATIEMPTGLNSPPFMVFPTVSAGDEVCLRTSTSGADMPGQWIGNGVGVDPSQPLKSDVDHFLQDPCDEDAFSTSPSQFFGTLDPFFYTDVRDTQPPDTTCSQPGMNGVDFSIAAGIDHNLSSFEPDYPLASHSEILIEGDGCPQGPPTFYPNTMGSQQGFTAFVLKCGLLGISSGLCDDGPVIDGTQATPRLQTGPYYAEGTIAEFAGKTLENKPLWDFIIAPTGVPGSCQDLKTLPGGADNWDFFDKKEALLDCLGEWKPGDPPLFGEEVLLSSRFSFLPQIYETALAVPVHFNSFVPVWFQKIYQADIKVGNPDPMCWSQAENVPGKNGWYWHEPGQYFDPSSCARSNMNVDRLSGIVLDCGMLPGNTCTPDDDPSSPGGDPVYRIMLSK